MDFDKSCETLFPDELGKTTFLLQGINFPGEWQTITKHTDQYALEQTMQGLEETSDWDDLRVIREADFLREQAV